jgi:hypothetical protein
MVLFDLGPQLAKRRKRVGPDPTSSTDPRTTGPERKTGFEPATPTLAR